MAAGIWLLVLDWTTCFLLELVARALLWYSVTSTRTLMLCIAAVLVFHISAVLCKRKYG